MIPVSLTVFYDLSVKDPERDALAWVLMLQCWPEARRNDAYRNRDSRFAVAMHHECWRGFARSMWLLAGRKLGRPGRR